MKERTRSRSCFSIFTVVCLHFILHQCQGSEVIQPQLQTVNPDGFATIVCEYTTDGVPVVDVRLYSITTGDNPTRSILCQKGKSDCKNVAVHSENPRKWLFILLQVGPEDMDVVYECEFTVTINDLEVEKTASEPTRLRQGRQETGTLASPAAPPQPQQLRWMLIGLLAVLFVYACVLTGFYFSLRRERLSSSFHPELHYDNIRRDVDNAIYVEMRKAPVLTNKSFSIYN